MRTRPILLTATLLAVPFAASGWSAKTHIHAANEVLRDVVDDQQVVLGGYGTYSVDVDIFEALRQFPQHFRGGSVGPDGYPDIFTGQVYTHPNQSRGLVQFLVDDGTLSCTEAVSKGWCSACASTTSQCQGSKDDDVPLYFRTRNGAHERPKRFWRSIDWGRKLVEHAWGELEDARAGRSDALVRAAAGIYGTTVEQEALKALAFAFGYLSHFPGDGFGHNWVNLYAGGSWDYFDSHPEYEYRHVVIEHYVVSLMTSGGDPLPADTTDLSIAAPEWFVEKYLMREAVAGADSAAKNAAHIRFLYGYKDMLLRIKAALRLPDTLPGYPENGVGPPVFDANDPGSYSSIWSYLLNHCFDTLLLGALDPSHATCAEELYGVVFAGYINTRIRAVDHALQAWVSLSTDILRQGVLTEDFQVSTARGLLDTYFQQEVMPLVVPGANEPVRQLFGGLSCADVGPPNFSNICKEMVSQVRQVVKDELDATEAVVQQKFVTYLDAYKRMLCTLGVVATYWTRPEILMNVAHCDGSERECKLASQRKRQVHADIFLKGMDPRTFPPFQNTVAMTKLLLLTQADLTVVSAQANTLPILAEPIDLASAAFLRNEIYDKIIYESMASLDGVPPVREEDLNDPSRAVFDQFRKPPIFSLIRYEPARERLHWPFFDISEQDPDGDQIYLAYDLCPCLPQTREDNAKDADGDGIGDGCDPKFVFPAAAATIRAMPDAGFGPPVRGIKISYTNRLENTVAAACAKQSAASASAILDNMYAETQAHIANAIMDPATGDAVMALLTALQAQFTAHSMQCADSPPPGQVTSCR